jgi:hypothetical protein
MLPNRVNWGFSPPVATPPGMRVRIAIDIFRECGADGWVKKYEEELAD